MQLRDPKNLRRLLIFFFLLQPLWLKAQSDSCRCHIADIRISGNKRTRNEVFFRETGLRKGDSISCTTRKAFLEERRSFLWNTRLFLQTEIIDSLSGCDVYIHIRVRERWYIIPSPTFAIADRNLNAWWREKDFYRLTYGMSVTDNNFRGRAEKLKLDVIIGWRTTLGLSYFTPYLDKRKRLGLQLSGLYQQGHEAGALTRNDSLIFLRVTERNIFHRVATEVMLRYRPQFRIQHLWTAGWEYINVDDTISQHFNPDYLGNSRNRVSLPRLGYRFIYDGRNISFYPDRGTYLSASVIKWGVTPAEFGLLSMDAELRHFKSVVPGRLIYMFAARTELNSGPEVPYYFRDPLGYRYTVRGFENYLSEGRHTLLAENELRLKILDVSHRFGFIPLEQFRTIPLRVYLKVFTDQGVAFYERTINGNSLPNKLQIGWGAGLDFISYYEKILRVEYSFNNIGGSGVFLHLTETF